MKRKLLCALAAVMLLCIAHSWALASDDVTLSWSQAAATCEISDAYYCTAGGAQAFIAGGLTRIPVGADVYVTLTPLDGQSALSSAYVVFDGEMMPLEPGFERYVPFRHAGVQKRSGHNSRRMRHDARDNIRRRLHRSGR